MTEGGQGGGKTDFFFQRPKVLKYYEYYYLVLSSQILNQIFFVFPYSFIKKYNPVLKPCEIIELTRNSATCVMHLVLVRT